MFMLFGMLIVTENHKKGNSKSELESISELHYMAIYKYCYTRLRSNEHCYDVTNDVFVILCEKWDKLSKENIKAWLYRTANNEIKKFFRKHKKRLSEIEYIENLDDFKANSLTYEQDFENISDEVIDEHRDEILDGLSGGEKELYDMVFTKKLSYDEVCDRLSITKDVLKSRVYRLRQKINEAVHAKIK